MRLHDAVRIGVDAAHEVVRGTDYAAELTERVYRVFGADAGAGVTRWDVVDGRVTGMGSMVLSVTGAARLTPEQLAAAVLAATRHPSFASMVAGRTHERLSDVVDLRRFWHTQVYQDLHGHSEGRFPTAVVLARSASSLTFLGVHRQVRDLDDDELACLTALAEPLRSALAFRDAMDRAASVLGVPPPESGGPFTRREAEVIVLVSRGWTTERIARRLGISPTAVKNRLASARDRVGAATRSELVARWAQDGVPLPGCRPPGAPDADRSGDRGAPAGPGVGAAPTARDVKVPEGTVAAGAVPGPPWGWAPPPVHRRRTP